eukprot:TRINITY_DN31424_c0_g1_i10.p1 TRINITY_DN31424_c0_g1~~TRINITY_DN31424_c0_g1_i10.p1  ORF type:complete len:277 (-),score=21.38 TRINITY_DN31424_c0_g1_i10:123-953(-)
MLSIQINEFSQQYDTSLQIHLEQVWARRLKLAKEQVRMYWRTRLTAFLVGFGIAGGFAMFQIRNDIAQSHRILQSQSLAFGSSLEKKIEQWPDFGCEGIKVQRAHQPTSQCQGKKKNFREKFISAIQFLFLVNHTGVAIRRGIIRIRGNQQKEEYGIFCGILRTFALVVPFAKKCWSQAVQIVSVWLQLWLFSSLQSATLVVKLVKQQYYWQLYYQYQCQQQRLVFFIESIQYVLKRCDCWGDVSFLMGLGIVFCCFRASLNLKFPPVLGGNFKLR